MSKQLHEGRDEVLKNPDANDDGQGIRNKPSKAAQGSNCRRCKHDEVAYLLLGWRNITFTPTTPFSGLLVKLTGLQQLFATIQSKTQFVHLGRTSSNADQGSQLEP